MTFKWLSYEIVTSIQSDQVRQHGGTLGIRDKAAIEASLARPQSKLTYLSGTVDISILAAAYGYGFCQNHCFIDGNKRVAFMAMYVFLAINGYGLNATEIDATQMMLAVASGMSTEDMLAEWIALNMDKT